MKHEFDNTALGYECRSIIQEPHPDRYNYTAIFHVAGQEIPTIKVMNIDFNADFRTMYAEDILLECAIGQGTLAHVLAPNKEDIKVELTQISSKDKSRATMWFKGILMGVTNTKLKNPDPQNIEHESGDLGSMARVKMQLREQALEAIDMETVGGNYVSNTPWKLLRTCISDACSKIGGSDDEAAIGFTIQSPDNNNPRSQIVIKHGTPLIELPDILQFDEGGIYNAGLGAFIRRGMWYVWSLYNTTDVYHCKRTLTLLMAPKERYIGVERTYRNTDSDLTVVVTGDRNHVDLRETSALSAGNAVRYLDSTKTIEDFVKIDGNKAIAHRVENTSEFVGFSRKDGLNKAVTEVTTDNIFAETSKLASRDGSYLVVSWQNSSPELLRPDMNVRVKIDNMGVTEEYRAKIMQIHSYIFAAEQGLTSKQHLTETSITLFVESDFTNVSEKI